MPRSTLRHQRVPLCNRRSSSGQRGLGYSAAAQLPPPMPPSRRTAAASSTRRSLPPNAAAPPPHAAGIALGSQRQPLPGFSSYPVTPLFQRGRVRGGSSFCFRGRARARFDNGGRFRQVLPAGDSQGSRGHKDC
ncbi:hypothetical protein NDU88_001185 [Pleurodeles waltl]|uniref:Uncharacterized protein n=1 Tax=Pleurodeles waltl TaxID=8319 RepID=A0AAV7U6I7_PLEWA|nr:hypothetical protein NDU88_001185 [Pleurodeles waltl]